MKAFLEQYGIILVAGIVVLSLIAVAVFLKAHGTTEMNNLINTIYENSDNAVASK